MHNKIKWGVEKELKNIYVTRVFSFLSPICPYMISLIVLKREKKKAFTWLQACFLRDVRVICCNSLGDSHFQTNVIDDVESLFDYCLHITFPILCTHTSYTHYTQSLLNFVYMIVCWLIWSSLIEYNLMCKCKFFVLVENFKKNVFRSLKSLFSNSWLILIFASKWHHVFKTFLDHVHMHWVSKTALTIVFLHKIFRFLKL